MRFAVHKTASTLFTGYRGTTLDHAHAVPPGSLVARDDTAQVTTSIGDGWQKGTAQLEPHVLHIFHLSSTAATTVTSALGSGTWERPGSIRGIESARKTILSVHFNYSITVQSNDADDLGRGQRTRHALTGAAHRRRR